MNILYDAQLNDYIQSISEDLVDASNVKDVKILLASSNKINAFATKNNEIVFYSGLIEKMTNENQLQGVLAHELGHLASDHYIKREILQENNKTGTIASILGLGAVIAGAPQAGVATIIGGSAADLSSQLRHSRQHENEADFVALKLLENTNISPKGMVELFDIMQKQEKVYISSPPEFLSSHPSSYKRKDFIANNIKNKETISNSNKFDTFKLKLYASVNSPRIVEEKIRYEKDSMGKFLALSISANKKGDYELAKNMLDKAKNMGLENAWYFDMLGQYNYENGNFEESVNNYKKALNELDEENWIINFQIAESYLALGKKEALSYYLKSYSQFSYFSYTLKRIADFYAQSKNAVYSQLYNAKYYLAIGSTDQAQQHLDILEENLKQYNKEDIFVQNAVSDMKCLIEKKECNKVK